MKEREREREAHDARERDSHLGWTRKTGTIFSGLFSTRFARSYICASLARTSARRCSDGRHSERGNPPPSHTHLDVVLQPSARVGAGAGHAVGLGLEACRVAPLAPLSGLGDREAACVCLRLCLLSQQSCCENSAREHTQTGLKAGSGDQPAWRQLHMRMHRLGGGPVQAITPHGDCGRPVGILAGMNLEFHRATNLNSDSEPCGRGNSGSGFQVPSQVTVELEAC